MVNEFKAGQRVRLRYLDASDIAHGHNVGDVFTVNDVYGAFVETTDGELFLSNQLELTLSESYYGYKRSGLLEFNANKIRNTNYDEFC